ncbi:hypothetical protein E4T44_11784, partial [Aureobasidium sp. EXF-8845]
NTAPPLSALQHVEHPSFSILPSLKSLSVLDIDEVQYLDELSVLIRRSVDKLRELRIGIANLAKHKEFTFVWDGDNVQQVDQANPVMSCLTIGEKRLGGVLGILTGLTYDLRSAEPQAGRSNRLRRRSNTTIGTSQASGILNGTSSILGATPTTAANNNLLSSETVAENTTSAPLEEGTGSETSTTIEHVQALPKSSSPNSTPPGHLNPTSEQAQDTLPIRVKDAAATTYGKHTTREKEEPSSALSRKLSLEVFELEDVQLSVPIMLNAIDWSVLTTLTLLRCPNHEHLWKALRRQFSSDPSPTKHRYISGTTDPILQPPRRLSGSEKTFKLNLKHIYTDTVSHPLISFIKETLRPNSLESVFLLHSSSDPTSVSLDTIFKGVVRRHRTSLRKLLIDSGERGSETLPGASVIWRQWMFDRDIINFLGKMPCLKELGAALDVRDWHFFLQHLPTFPKLRSLYIPYLVNHSQGFDAREYALQVVDIVALRPELEICYLGIMKKCFEVLEQKPGFSNTDRGRPGINDDSGSEEEDDNDEGSVDEDDEDGDEDGDDDDDDDSEDTASDSTGTYEDSELGSEEDETDLPSLRLREILYYDDKVSIFKARHGRL